MVFRSELFLHEFTYTAFNGPSLAKTITKAYSVWRVSKKQNFTIRSVDFTHWATYRKSVPNLNSSGPFEGYFEDLSISPTKAKAKNEV